jgi:hypothetical protein
LESDISNVLLKDLAFQWFDKQAHGTFANWITLEDGILAQFRPLGFINILCEQLTCIQMVSIKSITSYLGRMEDILGAMTLTHTQVIVINVWFCVPPILEKNKELQMEMPLHDVIFSVLIYMYSKSLKSI